MADRIALTGVQAYGIHGLMGERDRPQLFEVDVEIDADLRTAARTDDLGQTIDYAEVAGIVRDVIAGPSFSLVESLAEAIAARVLSLGATRVRVSVGKPAAAAKLTARSVSVTVERPVP